MKYSIPNTLNAPRCPLHAIARSTQVENVRQINPFYAKQSQSQVRQNKHKPRDNNEI
jgi:hypothetical protein